MRRAVLTGAIVTGLGSAALGVLLAGGLMLLAVLARDGAGDFGLLLGALGLGAGGLSLALGLLLAWEGWRGLQGRPSGRFRLPTWGWWLVALLGVLVLGQVLANRVTELLLPFFHLLAAVLPALLCLALAVGGAAWRGGSTTARPVVAALAWGGLGAALLAMLIEGILLLGLLLVLPPVLNRVAPGLLAHLQTLVAGFQRDGSVDLRLLTPYLRSPWLLAGGVLLASGLVPLIEEAVKALAVPLVILTGRRVTQLDAFLIGVAAGAGFAMVEGVSNGAVALTAPGGWAATMAARAAAAALHCTVSGLAGLGWHLALVGKRPWRGLGLGLTAVVYHGLWNFAALGSLWVSLQQGLGGGLPAGGNPRTVPAVALMGLLLLVALTLLRRLPTGLAERPGETDGAVLS